MPNTELMEGIGALLRRPNLEPEARTLIELALEAQKSGRLPSIAALRVQTAVIGEAKPRMRVPVSGGCDDSGGGGDGGGGGGW
jgi:hypothetical protein